MSACARRRPNIEHIRSRGGRDKGKPRLAIGSRGEIAAADRRVNRCVGWEAETIRLFFPAHLFELGRKLLIADGFCAQSTV